MEKGCVYFFKHIGLSPIKIGYTDNCSPLDRFSQFKTYAPYGSEIVGFIKSTNPEKLEKILHEKYKNKRLQGEWFDIEENDINRDIDIYSKIEDANEKLKFQIEWAKKQQETNNKEIENYKTIKNDSNLAEQEFYKIYNENKKINKKLIAEKLGVSRPTIYSWIKKINK